MNNGSEGFFILILVLTGAFVAYYLGETITAGKYEKILEEELG